MKESSFIKKYDPCVRQYVNEHLNDITVTRLYTNNVFSKSELKNNLKLYKDNCLVELLYRLKRFGKTVLHTKTTDYCIDRAGGVDKFITDIQNTLKDATGNKYKVTVESSIYEPIPYIGQNIRHLKFTTSYYIISAVKN